DGSLLAYKLGSQTVVRRGNNLSSIAQSISGRIGGVVFDPNADVLYLAASTNFIYKYDTNTWAQLASYPIGEPLGLTTQFGVGVMAIAADSSRLFLRTTSGVRTYYIGPTPAVSAVTPNQGPAPGGTVVTITGSNLLATTGVTFGGVAASFV